ncbi:MAG: ParB/RepB/Spo0J family partition protein [bacterium]|nr:ParB/RepB/Spo0J family partition protein [bacterium]
MSVKGSRGLGRGLDALIPTNSTSQSSNVSGKPEGSLINVPTNSIRPNSQQPRQTFGDESLADLASSIQEHGIIQPLVVVKVEDGYELVAGERRLRAAKVIGLKEVPVIIRSAKELKKLELAMVENIQRDNLNVLDEARGYKRLMDEFSLSQEDVARKMGKSRSAVANKIRLLDLPVEVKRAINAGQISEGHGRALLGLDNPEQILMLCGLIIARKLSVRETEQKVNEVLSGQKISRSDKKEKDPNVLDLEKQLRESIGARVKIRSKRNGGSIVIDYTSQQELERILGLLK